jgi:hypothetical protein
MRVPLLTFAHCDSARMVARRADETAPVRPSQQRADGRTPAPRRLLCREAAAPPCAPVPRRPTRRAGTVEVRTCLRTQTIALIAPEPPSALPRASGIDRPSRCGLGRTCSRGRTGRRCSRPSASARRSSRRRLRARRSPRASRCRRCDSAGGARVRCRPSRRRRRCSRRLCLVWLISHGSASRWCCPAARRASPSANWRSPDRGARVPWSCSRRSASSSMRWAVISYGSATDQPWSSSSAAPGGHRPRTAASDPPGEAGRRAGRAGRRPPDRPAWQAGSRTRRGPQALESFPGAAYRRSARTATASAARSMSATTSSGRETIGTWLEATSAAVAPIRAAK